MNVRELIAFLKRAKRAEEIDEQREEIARLIPAVITMFEYDQQNYAHQYDLWMHCLHTVMWLPRLCEQGEKCVDEDDVFRNPDEMIYLAALLHDIGKPDCRVAGIKEDDTNMHYYGHPRRSMEIVRDNVLPLLDDQGERLSPDEKRRLLYYVEYHDDRMSLRMKHLRRHLNIGASLKEFQNLMLLQVADAKAHVLLPLVKERIAICQAWTGEYAEKMYQEILSGK